MSAVVEAVRVEVAKLVLQPGEVLLVKVPQAELENATIRRGLRDTLHRAFPGNACLIAAHDTDFSIVQPPPPA